MLLRRGVQVPVRSRCQVPHQHKGNILPVLIAAKRHVQLAAHLLGVGGGQGGGIAQGQRAGQDAQHDSVQCSAAYGTVQRPPVCPAQPAPGHALRCRPALNQPPRVGGWKGRPPDQRRPPQTDGCPAARRASAGSRRTGAACKGAGLGEAAQARRRWRRRAPRGCTGACQLCAMAVSGCQRLECRPSALSRQAAGTPGAHLCFSGSALATRSIRLPIRLSHPSCAPPSCFWAPWWPRSCRGASGGVLGALLWLPQDEGRRMVVHSLSARVQRHSRGLQAAACLDARSATLPPCPTPVPAHGCGGSTQQQSCSGQALSFLAPHITRRPAPLLPTAPRRPSKP